MAKPVKFTKNGITRSASNAEQEVRFEFDGWQRVVEAPTVGDASADKKK